MDMILAVTATEALKADLEALPQQSPYRKAIEAELKRRQQIAALYN